MTKGWMKDAVEKTDEMMHFFMLDRAEPACRPSNSIDRFGALMAGKKMPDRPGGMTTEKRLVTCPACLASADYASGAARTEHIGGYTLRRFGWPVGESVRVKHYGSLRQGVVDIVQVRQWGETIGVTGIDWSESFRPEHVSGLATQQVLL
jgi:hypothetical protein